MVDWRMMLSLYKAAGIEIVRVPIEDFNGDELSRLMRKAVDAVQHMVEGTQVKADTPRYGRRDAGESMV